MRRPRHGQARGSVSGEAAQWAEREVEEGMVEVAEEVVLQGAGRAADRD